MLKSTLTLVAFAFVTFISSHARAGSATWALNPTTDDWNTAANWMPSTVPNGPAEVATFQASNQGNISTSIVTEVGSIVFESDAIPYTITTTADLVLAGSGIENNSNITQTFIQPANVGALMFINSANAGAMTTFIQQGTTSLTGGEVQFHANSSAGSGVFVNEGAQTSFKSGNISFFDDSTAANAAFTNSGSIAFNQSSSAGSAVFETQGIHAQNNPAAVNFYDNSTAANATINNRAGGEQAVTSSVWFFDSATADHASITCEGTDVPNAYAYGFAFFEDRATAADATFTVEGSAFQGGSGGNVHFENTATAGNATFVLTGGSNGGTGGSVSFSGSASGGTAQFILSGNGDIDITLLSSSAITIGSLAGEGIVEMGPKTLTVGGNNLSTAFAGEMKGPGGKLVKEGTGTFEVTGPNTYGKGTTINAGALIVSNTADSATGPGPVQVNAGTFGGGGIVAGAVTIGTGSGTGAYLAPAQGAKIQNTLTLQSSLTFNPDSVYQCTFRARNNKARADKVIANGVTINGASFSLQGTVQGTLKAGLILTVISNTSTTPIAGTFSNLPDGGIIRVGGTNFQATYEGGDGNDLTLTVQ